MRLNVVSFNLRCCDDPDGNSIAERAPRLQKILEPLNADVFAFQEIRPKWVSKLNDMFSEHYEMFLCYRSKEKPEGLMTLWKRERFSCEERGHFWFSDTPNEESLGWDEKYHCPRICSYTVLREKESGIRFLMMNTHFGFGERCQTKSVDLIRSHRNRFSELKAFIAGDFNMLPETPGHLAIQEFFVDANAVTVCDRRSTFHAYDPSVPRKQHIDYLFCDPAILPQNFRILDESVGGNFPSDHFGIFATISF